MLEGALHHIDKEDNNCEEARAAKKVFETAPMLSKTTTPLAERCSVKKLSDVLLFLSKSSTLTHLAVSVLFNGILSKISGKAS